MWENENLGSGKGGYVFRQGYYLQGMPGRNSELKRKDKRAKTEVFSMARTVPWIFYSMCCYTATNCLFQVMWKAMILICIPERNWLLKQCTIKNFLFCCFSTKHNIFYFYIRIFSLGSPKNFDFHYHHHNTAKSCSPFLSAGQLRHEDVVRASCGHRGQLQDEEGNPRSLTHRAMKR